MAYAPCGSQHKDAVQVTLEQIDLIKRLIGQYPGHLAFVNDSTSKYFVFFFKRSLSFVILAVDLFSYLNIDNQNFILSFSLN